ncbi:MAG: hypothetical protein D6788_10390 [Planctomycetota bacterium]|nr:MAG: hypothetical protein D6788_10390 [Planctomycetota bacterium]
MADPVRLEWQVPVSQINAGQTVEIRLRAVAESVPFERVAAVEVVLTWSAGTLRLVDQVDPCTSSPCPAGTFAWSTSGFPDDSAAEGLNTNLDDGDALYRAFASLVLGEQAVVDAGGLWITTFRFEGRAPGIGWVDMRGDAGIAVRTRVIGGDPIMDITGGLGPAGEVLVVDDCLPPDVTAEGSRYLRVEPPPRLAPIAFRIFGDAADPRVSCIARYVQPDGTLALLPFFQTPAQWGTFRIAGRPVVPGAEYDLETVCQDADGSTRTSDPTTVSTWAWGDTNGDGLLAIDDLTRVIDGTEGRFDPGVTVWQLDLMPCRPDGVLDQADLNAVGDALLGVPYPCRSACEPGFDLDDYRRLQSCLTGPAVLPPGGCSGFDFNADLRVDLQDVARFQREFAGL